MVDDRIKEIDYANSDWISLVLFFGLILICIIPLNCFYKGARWALLETIIQIFKAPFGKVRFRDFFFADIITSLGQSLVDIGMIIAYFNTANFYERDPNIKKEGNFLSVYIIIVAFAPYWFRFWQCINKWKNSGNKMQLINSCKYLSKFGPPIAFYLGASKKVGQSSSFWAFFLAQLVTTLFCLYWDFRWDWGMFIGTQKNNRFLRDQIKFSPRYYYTCMVINTIIRFWWLIGIGTYSYTGAGLWFENFEVLTFLVSFTEIFRRAMWAILRVENEFFNNFEEYRDNIIIPPIKDDGEDVANP